MNKVGKFIFFGIVIVCSLLIIFLSFRKQDGEYKVIDNIINEVINSEEPKVVYINPSNCEECNYQTYQMKLLVKNSGLNYYYINLKSLSKNKIKKVYSKLKINDSKNLPTIAVYKDKKLDNSIVGITGINKLFNMLNDHNILNSDKPPINYLNLTTYVDKIEEDNILLAIGSYKDNYSNQVEETLWDIAINYNIDINFIYLYDLTPTEGKLFESKIHNFNDTEVVIPSLLLIRNHKIVDMVDGFKVESDYVEFLQRNGIME